MPPPRFFPSRKIRSFNSSTSTSMTRQFYALYHPPPASPKFDPRILVDMQASCVEFGGGARRRQGGGGCVRILLRDGKTPACPGIQFTAPPPAPVSRRLEIHRFRRECG